MLYSKKALKTNLENHYGEQGFKLYVFRKITLIQARPMIGNDNIIEGYGVKTDIDHIDVSLDKKLTLYLDRGIWVIERNWWPVQRLGRQITHVSYDNIYDVIEDWCGMSSEDAEDFRDKLKKYYDK